MYYVGYYIYIVVKRLYTFTSLLTFSDEQYTFEVMFRQAEDYPVDLYFLMDVSHTMEQFKETLKNMSYILG